MHGSRWVPVLQIDGVVGLEHWCEYNVSLQRWMWIDKERMMYCIHRFAASYSVVQRPFPLSVSWVRGYR